jgi:hypothetical protein
MDEQKGWKEIALSKLPELFYIVLILVGVGTVLLAAGVKYKDLGLSASDPVSRIALAVFGVAVILFGWYRMRATPITGEQTFSAKAYGVQIITPSEGATVSRVTVSGSIAKSLPTGFTLWVFRVYNDGGFLPLHECAMKSNGTQWEAIDCDLGGKKGEKRYLSVNIVGPNGASLISYYKSAYERFKTVRDRLVSATNDEATPYMPSIRLRTNDMWQCDSVRLNKE